MRTIISTPSEAVQVPPVQFKSSLPTSSVEPSHVSDNTAPVPIISANKTACQASRWTWDKTFIRKVQYNKQIQEWMDYDADFSNWIRTCIMLHADSGAFETKCTIPDQWREDVGEFITIVTANYIPVRRGDTHEKHEVKEGVFHVMA